MSDAPIVTISCNTYNHEKYIRDALEGFVNQITDFKYEVIVHDDASTDGTADIIREYEKKYPDIIKPIYQSENQYSQGKQFFLNFVLPKVQGKYLAVCEGDDYWIDNNKLQKQFDYMETHPDCSLVAHKSLVYHVDENIFTDFTSYDFSKPENCELTAQQIIENHLYFTTASMFFKTDYYANNYEFLKGIRNLDYVKKILLATEGTVHVIPEIMSVYRKGVDGSWTKRVRQNKAALAQHIEGKIKILNKINEYRNYKYNDEMQKNIMQLKLTQQIILSNKAIVKDKEYVEFIKTLSLKKRMQIYVQLFAPHSYSLLSKIKRGIVRRKKRCQKPIP